METGWLRRALEAKRDGDELPSGVWERIVEGYVAGSIDDAPVAALLMACAIRGMGEGEIEALTDAMVRSGDVLQFRSGRTVVDKHSSGGVGDTVSLIAVPLAAACGVPVAKLSGRALGHTGGTLDKLEAIPGVRTDLSPEQFVAQVDAIGCAIAAQSERLVPADKKLYALRDRTGSVPSVGLIAASIVSKKIAGGADAIVFDVKAGRGAFMRTLDDATELARALVTLAGRFDRRASALVSDMDEPLGPAVGTGIEAIEARDFLRGVVRDERLAEAVLAVTHEMLRVGGVVEEEIAVRAQAALDGGAAYERFVQMIEAQGGSGAALEALAVDPARSLALAAGEGIVVAVDTVALGELARELVDADGPCAGIRVVARVGTQVRHDDVLAECAGASADADRVARAFRIGDIAPANRAIVETIVRDDARSLREDVA
ncbi:MAG TPA: thymidine phosphorylase [Candidatus Baltobacteraceae bacterium]|nr:thymidine phosphorylase [Candidatus Baltobacteraceae bacterium]